MFRDPELNCLLSAEMAMIVVTGYQYMIFLHGNHTSTLQGSWQPITENVFSRRCSSPMDVKTLWITKHSSRVPLTESFRRRSHPGSAVFAEIAIGPISSGVKPCNNFDWITSEERSCISVASRD